ncbi:MAG: acyl-CoA dehydrogenase family protein [Betaproteobacteria bacterium]|nr:acyl-CoA dehydrogenase family protein [Betaproteobacteria bacterium]
MDLRFTPEEIALRDEVRAFCKTAQPESIRRKLILGQHLAREDYVTWQRILDAKGWGAPHWPREWGGKGWSAVQLYIFNEELQRAPALLPDLHNTGQVGPVIIAFGTEKQKRRFLPRIRNLDYWFCQGFSEPGAGSDLASLKTSAVRDGDDYVVNGEKTWTTYAHMADWMFALVRTDPTAKKQKGISYLLIDLKTPGVTIRPIITMGGVHRINEVFLDNVRVPVENRIGEDNRGWEYAKYLMGNSRTNVVRLGLARAHVERAKQLATHVMVNGTPLSENERFREKLAAVEIELKAIEITIMRIVAERMKNPGYQQDPKSSILKLKASELHQIATEILLEVAGPLAMPAQPEFLELETDLSIGPGWAASAAPTYFMNRSWTIAGGSSEIQRNIIAKRILGL